MSALFQPKKKITNKEFVELWNNLVFFFGTLELGADPWRRIFCWLPCPCRTEWSTPTHFIR